MVVLRGSDLLRGRVIAAFLSETELQLRQIRELHSKPGLTEPEVTFLRLVSQLTDGTKIHINTTGTGFSLRPGKIIGGSFDFDCTPKDLESARSIVYFVEGILPICLFAQQPVHITFTGPTECWCDHSPETYQKVMQNLLGHFDVEFLPRIEVRQRASVTSKSARALKETGLLEFFCQPVRGLKSIDLTKAGFVSRIRGLATSLVVSPQFCNRMIDEMRGIFNSFIPDVYVNTNALVGKKFRASSNPYYDMALWAETTTGTIYSSKRSCFSDDMNLVDPEEVARTASFQLLEEIAEAGCVDSSFQWVVLLLMVLCRDVSRVRVGELSEYSMEMLRLLHSFFRVKFQIVRKQVENSDRWSTILSCKGIGLNNSSRIVT